MNLELRATTLISGPAHPFDDSATIGALAHPWTGILLPLQWRRQLFLCLTKTAALPTTEQLLTFLKLRCSSESHVSVDIYIFVVPSLSHLRLCDPVICSTPGSSGLYYLPRLLGFMSIDSVMLANHLILCCPLLLPSIFAFPPPADHILSELFTMTHLPWVALHLMAHSFNELCKLLRPTKAVIHEGASYIYYSTNQSQPHWILCSLKTLVVELTR